MGFWNRRCELVDSIGESPIPDNGRTLMVVSQKLGLLSLSLLVDGMGIEAVPRRQSETISCALSTSIALKSTPILKNMGLM